VDIRLEKVLPDWSKNLGNVLSPELISPWMPDRPANGHKGTFGKVLVIGGSANYIGAPALAARAACRSGAGLVTIAAPQRV
ncbi:NAD(P)H-hydrate dehydratase, partial [Escherichia coli]|uniref:NAD(P)H-hydrate dehydratase n=1 Tax=Escherichia coli TaxID=562 RepID=UPI0028DF50BB